MKKYRIKLIIRNVYSKRDINGNCYWVTYLKSTKDGSEFSFVTPHSSNSNHIVRSILDWAEMYSYEEEMPIRQFNHMKADYKIYTRKEEKVIENKIKEMV